MDRIKKALHKKNWENRNVEHRKQYTLAYYQKNKERIKAERYANREAIAAKHRDIYKNKTRANPGSTIYQAAKMRAKKKGLSFTIEKEDVVIPDLCPILGIPLFKGDLVHHFGSPSLDRIDPTKGYVKGNVWVISRRANVIKNDATVSELRKVADAVEKKSAEVKIFTHTGELT